MSTNPLPENDLPDLQTKNPNPPDLDHSDESPVIGESPFVAPPNFRGRPARHGLRSRRLFIAPEDVDRFDRFRRNTIRELSPIDHTEHFIVEAIVTKRWLILHCDEAEAAAMRNAFVASEHLTAAQMESNAKDAPRDDDERFDHAMAATCTDEKVHLVLRYRTIHERGLVRFETMLRQYRALCEAREIADARMRPANPPYYPPADSPPVREPLVRVEESPGRQSFLAPTLGGIPSREDSSEIENLKSGSPTLHRKPNAAEALANLSRRNSYSTNPRRDNDLADHQTNCRNSLEAEGSPHVETGATAVPRSPFNVPSAPSCEATPSSPSCLSASVPQCLPQESPPPDNATTLALRARILEDIKDYYAHLKSQTPESDGVPTENPLEQSDAAPES